MGLMGPGQDPYGALRAQMNGPKWARAQAQMNGPNRAQMNPLEWAQMGPGPKPNQMNGTNRA